MFEHAPFGRGNHAESRAAGRGECVPGTQALATTPVALVSR